MSKVNGKKLGRKALLSVILSAVFVAGSGVTAFAAGTEASKVGQDMYINTMQSEIHDDNSIVNDAETFANDDYVEYRLAPGEWNTEDVTIIQMSPDEGEATVLDTTKLFDWDIPADTMCVSGNFLKTKGSTILISCYVESSTNVRVGIVEPDGTLLYVLGKGQVTHTFPCDRFGFYKVAVYNTSSKAISVSGYYRR